MQLFAGENAVLCEQVDILLGNPHWESIRGRLQVVKTTFFSLFNPLICITVTVEDHTFVFLNGSLNQFMNCMFHIFRSYTIKLFGKLVKSFRNSCIQYNIRVCNRSSRTKHTELEFVSGKCKWWSTVSVSIVFYKVWQNNCSDIHLYSAVRSKVSIIFDRLQNFCKFITKENRYNCGRSLVGTKSVIISCTCNGDTKKISIFINCFNNCH